MNPDSTQSIAISLILSAKINSSYSITYQNCSTTFAVSTPNSFQNVIFDPSNKTISATNSISLLLNLTNPIYSNSYLRFTTSLSLTYQYVFYIVSGVVPQNYSASTGQLLIGNLTASNPSSYPKTLSLLSFNLTNP